MARNSYIPNPFSGWGEFDPKRVYGRTRLLQSIIELVTENEPSAVNLTGPRWIGKTVVLRFLANPEGCFTKPEYESAIGQMFTLSRLLLVYVDMATSFCPENPFATLADKLYIAIKNRKEVDLNTIAREIYLGKETTALTRTEVEKRMLCLTREAANQGIRLIVCLDHVDHTNILADSANVRQIETLAEDASVVMASREILRDLYPGLAGSPFVLRLVIKRTSLLDKDAAFDLLSPPLLPSSAPQFCSDDKELLVDHVGRHPYLLIRAARQAYEYLLSSPRGARLTPNYVQVEIAPALEFIFEHLWHESASQLRAFYQLRRGESTSLEEMAEDTVLPYLQEEALIYESLYEAGQYLFFSPLFESFVAHKLQQDAALAKRLPTVDSNRILEDLGLNIGTKEGQLLSLLASNAGKVIPDEEILNTIWGDNQDKHALDTTVARLRSKIKQRQNQAPGRIVRHRNRGFSFEYTSPNTRSSVETANEK